MLRSQGLSAIFNENLDSTASAIFLSTTSGHLIGSSSPSQATGIPASLIRKAVILGTSTFAHHAERQQQQQNSQPLDSTANSSALTNFTHSASGSASGHSNGYPPPQRSDTRVSQGSSESTAMSSAILRGASGAGMAGYLAIQPLAVLARTNWVDGDDADDDSDGDDEDANAAQKGLRRIVVEIPIGRSTIDTDSDNARKSHRLVTRACAIERIGQALCLGVLGAEREDVVPDTAASQRGDFEAAGDADEEADEDEAEEERRVQIDREREWKREIRLLSIRTEALAEFMREQFSEFKMPGTVTL